jgi:hypothetical protein
VYNPDIKSVFPTSAVFAQEWRVNILSSLVHLISGFQTSLTGGSVSGPTNEFVILSMSTLIETYVENKS